MQAFVSSTDQPGEQGGERQQVEQRSKQNKK